MISDAPNILIVMADQMAPAFLPIYGHRVVRAPIHAGACARRRRFRQRLLHEPAVLALAGGVHVRAFCRRARASTTTPPNSRPTFRPSPITLRLRGYRTILSGKMHFCGPDQLHGFEERLTTDIYPADYGWTPDWDHPDDRPTGTTT